MKALLITAIVVILILAVIFIPIRLCVRLCYNNDGFDAGYNLFFGFIRLKKSGKKTKDKQTDTEPEKKTEKKRKLKKKSVLQIIRFIRSNIAQIKNLIYNLLDYMFNRGIKFEKIDIKLVLGTEDAMVTALSYGGASAFIYNTVAALDTQKMLKKHRIELKPDFNNTHILTDDTAIISTNIFNITVLIFILLRDGIPLLRKYKRFCASDTGKDGE